MATITQTTRKDPTGGWMVYTYVDGQLRRETWTAGSTRDARQVAAEDRKAVTA